MRKYWSQIDMDGIKNVWILKPGNKSRGRGIVLMNKLEDVMAKVNPTGKSDTRYVVQKYIGKLTSDYNNLIQISDRSLSQEFRERLFQLNLIAIYFTSLC